MILKGGKCKYCHLYFFYMTIFDKIITKEIPSFTLYEDECCIVIVDINPIFKGHSLVISKESVQSITELSDDTLRNIINIVKRLDKKMRDSIKADAVNVLLNDGKEAGQEIPHVHFHVIPRFKDDGGEINLSKKTKYAEGEAEKYSKLLRL